MNRLQTKSALITIILLFYAINHNNAQSFQDIFRVIDPLTNGGSKSIADGPPFLRFGTQQYYYHANWCYDTHQQAVNNAFSSWNSVGTVQFIPTSSYQNVLSVIGFFDQNVPPYSQTGAPNPGSTHVAYENNIINPYTSWVELNTAFTWRDDGVQNVPGWEIDTETILVHEIGHIQGLAHPLTSSYVHDATAPIMAGGENEYFWTHIARSLRNPDINGTRYLQYNTFVPAQCSTIEAAITNSFAGVTIRVAAGTYQITNSITVPVGVALVLSSGTTLNFQCGSSLIINGTLTATGSSTNQITFTGNSWGGIRFNNGSSGNLQYCNIQNANMGIYLYNSSPQINFNTISNCNIGVNCYYYSSPIMHGNLIEYNNYGIYCDSGSSPNLSTSNMYGNVIRYNTYDGIHAIYGSNPTLTGTNQYGNSVYGNGSRAIYAIYSCNINAIYNWWGTSSPNPTTLFTASYSTITYQPYLTSNPNYSIVIDNDQQPTSIKVSNVNASTMGDNLDAALEKQRNKKYDEAIPLFLKVFKNNTDALLGVYALSKIEECFTQAGKKDYLDYSKSEIKPLLKEGTEIYVEAIELETHQMVNAGSYKDAINNLQTILKKYNLNNYIEKNTLFRLGAFYYQFYGDTKSSDKYFNELKQKYPDDELVNQIDVIKSMGVITGAFVQSAGALSFDKEAESEMENTTEFGISNYPNPFNPTTKISFSIPRKDIVKLKVFDVLGREIATLANDVYEAGKYEVEFNASNFPSGVYFYNLITSGSSVTKKMILVK